MHQDYISKIGMKLTSTTLGETIVSAHSLANLVTIMNDFPSSHYVVARFGCLLEITKIIESKQGKLDQKVFSLKIPFKYMIDFYKNTRK
jgi:hypothetical protein